MASRSLGVGRTRVGLAPYYTTMLALLYLPIGLLFVFSFTTNTLLTFPIRGLTTHWYAEALGDAALVRAATNSLLVGLLAASVATVLGASIAIAVVRFRFRGRFALLGLAVIPLIVPFVVLGVSLLVLFNFADIPRSLLTIAAGHTVIALPFATLILLARLATMDPSLEDAAMDLGATYRVALQRVIAPIIAPTLLSAWLTAFIISFDEVAIALFLAGRDPTFPVFLYGQLRFAQRLPVLIAMAVLLMLGTLLLTLIAFRLRRNEE